jgi:outer membrane lipoprotein SlyB
MGKIMIIIVILLLLVAGCAGAKSVAGEIHHSYTQWIEQVNEGNVYIQKTTIIEDNVTCYSIVGGTGVGIYCMDGIK